MSKGLAVLILIAPFLLISFYWVIFHYIDLLFEIEDVYSMGFVSTMLTALVAVGIGVLIDKKVRK